MQTRATLDAVIRHLMFTLVSRRISKTYLEKVWSYEYEYDCMRQQICPLCSCPLLHLSDDLYMDFGLFHGPHMDCDADTNCMFAAFDKDKVLSFYHVKGNQSYSLPGMTVNFSRWCIATKDVRWLPYPTLRHVMNVSLTLLGVFAYRIQRTYKIYKRKCLVQQIKKQTGLPIDLNLLEYLQEENKNEDSRPCKLRKVSQSLFDQSQDIRNH